MSQNTETILSQWRYFPGDSSEYRPLSGIFCCARITVTSPQQVMEYRHV
ncbi:MAG: hypothetical protein AAF171_19440 [Cyanobacteria bacterium P01_A01_bin.116]